MIAFSGDDRFLVTGASSGIGRSLSLLLVESGATVIGVGRDSNRLKETKAMASAPRMHIEQRDLGSDLPGLAAWLKSVTNKYGTVKGLANCAGITWNSPLSYYNLSKVEQVFNINCHAPLILAGSFCSRNKNGGAVVNISAAASIDPNPGQGVYAAAKAALVAGSKCLAREAAQAGIRVNCVSPGLVTGPMFERTCAELGPAFVEREAAAYPLGIGKPVDVANLVMFLLSDQAAWITGQNFLINGGR